MTMTNVSPPARGRHVKFTPQAIDKIKEFVAEGISRDEIANQLGVTVGSLQVTCSRLGISYTLADLFTLLFAANPFSAAWASPWRWSSDEFEDGLAHGGQCRSRRRPVDSFFPALLF